MWPLRSPSLGYQDSIVKTDTSVLSIASEGEKKSERMNEGLVAGGLQQLRLDI